MKVKENDFEIINCICAWYDLLGFGQPFIDANWNLDHAICANQLDRVKSLDLTHSNKYSYIYGTTSLNLNDGIILNFDINANIFAFKESLVNVLDDFVLEFESLNYIDSVSGHPGIRGVLTFGHRYNYTQAESTVLAATSRTIAYHPKEFQMNTAFSKAYIIESSGSKAGISGNNLYVDEFLIAFIENTLKEGEGLYRFRIEKNLNDDQEQKYFSIFQDDTLLLKLEFDKEVIEYNFKGITTKLFKYLKRESKQDELAREAAFREGQRYLRAQFEE